MQQVLRRSGSNYRRLKIAEDGRLNRKKLADTAER
jgi:hypothetical protein